MYAAGNVESRLERGCETDGAFPGSAAGDHDLGHYLHTPYAEDRIPLVVSLPFQNICIFRCDVYRVGPREGFASAKQSPMVAHFGPDFSH